MQVCVIKNTEPRKASLPLTGAFCGLVGYTLKNNMPILLDEVDSFYPNKAATLIDRNAKVLKDEYITKLSKTAREGNEAADLFVRKENAKNAVRMATSNDSLKIARQNLKNIRNQIKNAPDTLKQRIAFYSKNAAQKVSKARNISGTVLEAAIKSGRSNLLYTVPGVVLGVVGAFVYNVVGVFKD